MTVLFLFSTKNEGSLLGNGASPETEKNEDQPPNFASRAAKETPQTELPLDSSLASDPILPVAANGNEPVEQLSRQQSFFDGYPIDVISGRPRGPTIFGRRPRKKVQLVIYSSVLVNVYFKVAQLRKKMSKLRAISLA